MQTVLHFETSRYIAECPEVVFDAFVDPDDLNEICLRGFSPVLGLASNPGQIGAAWYEKIGPLSLLRVKTALLSVDRPRLIEWQKSGAFNGRVRVAFTPSYRGTLIEQIVEIRRRSSFLKSWEIRERTEASLQQVKAHLEPNDYDPLFTRIRSSVPRITNPPHLISRHELCFEFDVVVRCLPQTLYAVITDLCSAWRWNVDRADPSTEYDIAGNWPEKGATAAFRFRSGLRSAEGWETGRLEVIESTPFRSFVMSETQDCPPEMPIYYTAHYRLDLAAAGCTFSVEYRVGAASRMFEQAVVHDPDSHTCVVGHFRKETANLIRVAEGKEQ